MTRETRAIQVGAPVRDADLLPSGQWVVVAGRPATTVHFQDRLTLPTPAPIAVPLVRGLDADRIILVERRASQSKPSNAWIVRRDGSLEAEFHVGEGIEDVLASRDSIVVTYFDEGVFAAEGPSQQGLAVFRTDGAFDWGYRDQLAVAGVSIDDCYCACWLDPSHVAFSPYSAFPLVTLDIKHRQQEVLSTPDAVHGARAVTFGGDTAFFHAPMGRDRAILAWKRGESQAEFVEDHAGRLRGLSGGRFLGVQEEGLVILSFE